MAAMEMRVALEEFHRVIPGYELAPTGVEFVSGRSKTIPQFVPLTFTRELAGVPVG